MLFGYLLYKNIYCGLCIPQFCKCFDTEGSGLPGMLGVKSGEEIAVCCN